MPENNKKQKKAITTEDVRRASEILGKYISSKASFDKQIRENEEWWRLNHWSVLRAESKDPKAKERPTSAWTFNSIVNKHADMMDNIPTSVVMPREKNDEESAKKLTSILPVINERCGFEKVYSDNGWYKLKNGLSVFAVLWDNDAGPLGDVAVKKVDVLNIFWEPNISDIQDSQNVFVLTEKDIKSVEKEYKLEEGTISGGGPKIEKYATAENEDEEKCVVVDWYYKRDGVLHFAKFCGDTLLFASENEEGYENGYYEHGKYPFVFDAMYPLEGTLFAFGIVEVCRGPQAYIDTLDGLVIENLKKQAKPRYFYKKDSGINATDFEDDNKTLVSVEGNINDERLRRIEVQDVSSIIGTWKQSKIDELKETSSNRDVSQGSTSGGVTSGAAIATLQEAGNKTSRDFIASSFRVFCEIEKLEIELIRQFYTEKRMFRIVGEDGVSDDFIEYDNSEIKPDVKGKEPIFDLVIKAQKKSPFSQTALNETAMNLYSAGFFNPDNAQASIAALEMMDFDGIQQVKNRVKEGYTLKRQLEDMQQQLVKLAETVRMLTGGTPTQPMQATSLQPTDAASTPSVGGMSPEGGVSVARSRAEELAANGYARDLVKKASPDIEGGNT